MEALASRRQRSDDHHRMRLQMAMGQRQEAQLQDPDSLLAAVCTAHNKCLDLATDLRVARISTTAREYQQEMEASRLFPKCHLGIKEARQVLPA